MKFLAWSASAFLSIVTGLLLVISSTYAITAETLSVTQGPVSGGQHITISGTDMKVGRLAMSQVSAGEAHTCGIYDGAAYCWGVGTNGQLGSGALASSSVPVAVDTSGALNGKTIIAISAGNSFTTAIADDGQVYAWGANSSGQLGDNAVSGVRSAVPVAVNTAGVLNGKTITAISSGGAHTLALADDGKVYTWGLNGNGQLGDGTFTQRNAPVATNATGVLLGKTVVSLGAGTNHSLAVTGDGHAYSWGYNGSGQLGDGTTTRQSVPVAVNAEGVLAGKVIVTVSGGANHSAALASDGIVYTWGLGTMIGDDLNTISYVPAVADATNALGGEKVVDIDVGSIHTVAVTEDGKMYAWGTNTRGQLGDSSTTARYAPVAVTTTGALGEKAIVAISAGSEHTVAVAEDGQMYAWGFNSSGRLGDGTLAQRTAPVAVDTTGALLNKSVYASNEVPAATIDGAPVRVTSVAPDGMSLTVRAEPHATGTVDISIGSFDGATTSTLPDAYTFMDAPDASSVLPASGSVVGGDTVTITGQNFTVGAKVKIGNDYATNVSVLDGSTITAVVPPAFLAGVVEVAVEDIYGQTSVVLGGFTYEAVQPIVASISPEKGPTAGNQQVIVSGTNMQPGILAKEQISGGNYHTCGIYDGDVFCWGYGAANGSGSAHKYTPAIVGALRTETTPYSGMKGKTITAVSSGNTHTLALTSDGKVYAWGANGSGQLGDGTTTNRTTPVAVDMTGVLAGKTVRAIIAGGDSSFVIANDGKVYAWGENGQYQLGNSPATDRNVPIAVDIPGEIITEVSAGMYHTLALTANGQLYVWGSNQYGQYGDGGTISSAIPVAVNPGGALAGKSITSISAGGYHFTTALADDGKVYGWGYNGHGQLGNNTITSSPVPVAVDISGVLANKTVVAIIGGLYHTLALADDGSVYGWGYNAQGQLGNNATTNSPVPVTVDASGLLAGKTVTAISAGLNHSMALSSDGQLFTWGENQYGGLGDTTTVDKKVPVAVDTTGQVLNKSVHGVDSYSSVMLGSSPVQIINSDLEGTQLTGRTSVHDAGVVDMSVGAHDGRTAPSVLADSYEFMAAPEIISVSPDSGSVAGGDTVTITGQNFNDNTRVRLGITYAESITVHDATSLSLTVPSSENAGFVDVVVEDEYGQRNTLVNGFEYTERPLTITSLSESTGPSNGLQQVTITGQNFAPGVAAMEQISMGDNHACGIYGGAVYCWGLNGSGQLGDGSGANQTIPIAVDTTGVLKDKVITAVAVGSEHSVALSSDGKVYSWGEGAYGRLGEGSTADRPTPVAVDASGALLGKTVVAITVGRMHSLALTSDGSVYAWGYNSEGQLGDSSSNDRHTPVPVYTVGELMNKKVVAISAGYNHSLALTSDGRVYAWGGNASGQLGDGNSTSADITRPVSILYPEGLAGKFITSISAGYLYSLALTSDGAVYAWGSNSGKLGDGTSATKLAPVPVDTSGALSGKVVSEIATGSAHSFAITKDGKLYAWGADTYGGLGEGAASNATQYSPVAVDTSGILNEKVIVAVDGNPSSGGSSIAITSDGQIVVWGRNNTGQLGDNSTQDSAVPVSVDTTNIPAGRSVNVTSGPPRVTFGGVEAFTLATAANGTSVTVATPPHAEGAVDVRATNYDGQYDELLNAYTFIGDPQISAVAPTSGSVTGGDTVTINGASFTAQTKVSFGGVDATTVNYIDSTTLSVIVPAGASPGIVDVVVKDDLGQQSVLAQSFTYRVTEPAVLHSISPAEGLMNGGGTITIAGSGFMSKTGGGTWYRVWLGDIEATNVTYVNETTLTARVPAGSPGKVDVTVGGEYVEAGTLQGGYQYLAQYYAFTGTAPNIETNAAGKMTITSQNASRTPITSTHDTVITLSSSSATGVFAVNLSEDEATRWDHTQVVLPAGQSSVDIWYKDSVTVNATIRGEVAGAAAFTQAARVGTPYRLQITGLTNPIKAGVSSSVTVRVVDTNGNSRPDYTGILAFSSPDAAAKIPNAYTMQASDYGIKTFTNGVTFGTQGAQCVRVADSLDPVITGTACATVQAPSSGVITKFVITTPEQRVAAGKSSATITVQTQDSINEAIPVAADTPVYLHSNSSTGEFSLDGETWQGLGDMPVEATMLAGTSSINVRYRDSAAAMFTLSARDLATDTGNSGSGDQGWRNAAQQITMGVSPPTRLVLVGPDTLVTDTEGAYRVELQDDVGNIVTADTNVAVRIDGSTTTSRFYVPENPTVAAEGPVEFMIPEGESGIGIGILDTTLSVGTNYTQITATDARPDTEVVRLNDALFDIQIVSSLASDVVVRSSELSVVANTTVPVTVEIQNETGDAAYVAKATEVALSANPAGEFSLTADPFVPVSSVGFARGELGQKTVYYRSMLAGTMSLSASVAGLSTTAEELEVTSDALARYGIAPSSLDIPRGTASNPFTVTGYDIYGNIVTQASDHTAYLHSSSSTTEFSDVSAETWGVTSIVIPAGESTAQFVMRDSDFSDAPILLTVSDASSLDDPDTGVLNGTASVTITSEAVERLTVSTPARTVAAGEVSSGITVQLQKEDGSPAYQDGTSFVDVEVEQGEFLASSDPEDVVIRLAVPKGQAQVAFYYTGTVAGVYAAEFAVGAVTTTQNVTVEAAEATAGTFTTPVQTIQAGVPSDSFVVAFYDTYNNPATLSGDTTVSLASSCATGVFSESATDWQAMSTITAPAGASDATFYYSDIQAGDCTITVSIAGFEPIAQAVTVENNNQPVSISIESAATQPQIKGSDVSVVVSLRSIDGTIVGAVIPTTVHLSTSSDEGVFTPTDLVFQPGESTLIATYYEPAAGEVTLTAHDQTGLTDESSSMTDGTLSIEYVEGAVSGVALTAASVMNVGQKYSLTVSLVNENGIPTNVVGASRTVALSSSHADGVFSITSGGAESGSLNVTIPAGQSTATIYYEQTKTGQATLRGTSNGTVAGEAEVTVLAGEVATIGFTNTPYTGARTLDINEAGTYTVSLYDEFGNVASANEALTLYIASSQPGELSATEVTIEPGQSSGEFTYKQSTAGAYTITVGTAPNGQPSDITAITQDGAVAAVKPQSFRFVQDAISLERGAVSGQITVELLDANGQVVAAKDTSQLIRLSMQSGSGQFAKTVNDTYANSLFLNVPAGQSTASFYYRNNTGSAEANHVIVGAATFAQQEVEDTLPVTLSYGEVVSLQFVTPNRSQQATHPSQVMTVEQRNRYGRPVPAAQDTVLHLRSSASETGNFGSSKVDWDVDRLTLPAGAASASFYYKDSATGTPTITVADSLPLSPDVGATNAKQGVTITEQIVPREVDNFLVTNISDPQHAGTLSSVVVIARDAEGYVVENYQGTIRFNSADPDAKVPTREYRMYPWMHKGVLTVSNAVSFSSPGEKSISVTDVDTGITGSQDAITVLSANANPVASIAFADAQSSIRLAPNEVSPYIAVQLLDAEGNPTSAPLEGFEVRLTSSSAGGSFATTTSGPWQGELVATVPAGASFAYVYYRDSVAGSPTISASDWVAGSDNTVIPNDALQVDVHALYVEGARGVKSLNALGSYEDSKYLYAHNNAGGIAGQVHAEFSSYTMLDDEATATLWRTQWRQGVTLLRSDVVNGARQGTSFDVNDIRAKAGDNDFYAIAESTQTSFDDLFSIASNQQTITVSPWRTVLSVDTSKVATQDTLTATTNFYERGVASQPNTAFVYLLPAGATSTAAALQTWSVAENAPGVTINTVGLDQQETYRILVVTYDADGETTSQSASEVFGLQSEEEETPPVVDEGTGEVLLPPGSVRPDTTPTIPTGDDEPETAPQPGLQPQPQPAPSGNGGETVEGKHTAMGISGYVAATSIASSVIVIALLREAYKEVSRVVRLRRLLRRENQLVEDKQTFLSLGAHYLRTPIAILDAAGSMVGPNAGTLLAPIVQSLKTKSEQLLANQNTAALTEIDSSEIKHASRNALLSVYFWIPIILSIVLTVGINWLLAAAQNGVASNAAVVYMTVIAIAIVLAAFFVARTIIINREREQLHAALERRREALFTAKSQFIQAVKDGLSGDVRRLNELKQSLAINQNPSLVGPINESIEKLNSLTGKLALASHINGVPLNPTEVSADVLVAGAVNAHVDQISQKQLKVNRNIVGHSGIKQDARLLNYVVASLVDNAVKFAPNNTELDVTASTFGGCMKVQVENATSGIGDESVIERMFEPFNHAATPADLTADGMGMSLYLNKLIMGHLGGSIEARRNAFKNTIEVIVRVNKTATL
ncbi:MAG: IPT/TIG domain-containing protein [Candidatus Microsaccharimonas sp.]